MRDIMRLHVARLLGALLTVTTTSGCVLTNWEPPHRSWPKPEAAHRIQQFDGVYRNHSYDASSGQAKAGDGGDSLFCALTSRTEARGTRVEIRSSSAGDTLHLRLLDDALRQITSADLRLGADYQLSGGVLTPRRAELGWRGKATRTGPIFGHESIRLQLAVGGGLLGKSTEGDVALGYGTVPMILGFGSWSFWPKISP